MTGWRNKYCIQLFYLIWIVAAMLPVTSCRHRKIDAGLAQVNQIASENPVMNPKIKGLYKKIMSENKVEESDDKISMVNKPVRNMGLINKGDSVNVSFSMFNRDSVTYHIHEIIPSCDCMTVESESSVLAPGEGTISGLSLPRILWDPFSQTYRHLL